jgi:hypothetical protein
VGRHNYGGDGRVRGGRVQFVDARELQEGVQQQVRRDCSVRVQALGLDVVGGRIEDRRALFCPASVGMNGQWMLNVKIVRVVVAAVAHKL